MKTIYNMTAEIAEWMNHSLVPVEAAVFRHYRGIIQLVEQVDKVEAGLQPKYAALSAIKRYNRENNTTISYEEIVARDPGPLLYPEGDWVAYVDDMSSSTAIVTGEHDDPLDALENADPDTKWILLWLPDRGVVIVYRSPHASYCGTFEDTDAYADGGEKGPVRAPTLPPEIVASMGRFDETEILYQHTNNNRNRSWRVDNVR